MTKGKRSSFLRVHRGRGPEDGSPVSEETAAPDATTGPSLPAAARRNGDESERIVIPRQERDQTPASDLLDLELREVRFGATSRGYYLRVSPKKRRFTRVAPGHIRASASASRPLGRTDRVLATIKRVLLGSPFANSRLIHERLTKIRALGVFSSDPLSSSAYSVEEIMLVLMVAGAGALYLTLPITGALLALLWLVRLSYLQTIRAYPNGGGAYTVARENLGLTPGLIAASALMVDYVLTVAVSVAAGVAAITSAFPVLFELRVALSLAAIALITWGNLRGIRESGAMFGLPTYFFIFAFGGMIVVGLFKLGIGDAPGTLLHSAPPSASIAATGGLSLFLILRAFSSGASAVTGIEAISNGVPAFKPPESHNARVTMQWEAAFLGFLLIGVAFLATRYGIVPNHDETVVSILGREVLGKNVLYYAYQVATAGVLFLAANTAYADFPRLAAILGRDRFAPRQLTFRGDRLGFSNGIMLLGAAASVLLIAFQAEITRLIPLYILGVFISMTLSQSGMVRHWLRLRERGWRTSLVLNGIGAVATGVVVLIVGATKVTQGAWISILGMLSLLAVFVLVRRHYDWVETRVQINEKDSPPAVPQAVPLPPNGPKEHVVVPVDEINKITLGAIAAAREISPLVTAVHVTDDRESAEEFRAHWNRAVPDIPLLIIESPYRAFIAPLMAFLERARRSKAGQGVTLVLPIFVTHHWWERLLHNRDVQRLKGFAEELGSVRVVEFRFDPAAIS